MGKTTGTDENNRGLFGFRKYPGKMNLQEKYDLMKRILADLGRVVVAYSGGVDSTLLLKAAADTLGPENVLACISTGPVEPENQLPLARKLAGSIGVELVEIAGDGLADEKFIANRPDRCFHCKSALCKQLLRIAGQRGFNYVVFGSNADDEHDFRPGSRAMKVHNIRCPLAEAGLDKDEIRRLSRQLGLGTADLPANPCLASRIAYGLEITRERLRQIDHAEQFLHQLGFTQCRVRHHDTIARIEVRCEELSRLISEPVRSKVVEKLKSLGFTYVAVDLQGFRSGSMNESLSQAQKSPHHRGRG